MNLLLYKISIFEYESFTYFLRLLLTTTSNIFRVWDGARDRAALAQDGEPAAFSIRTSTPEGLSEILLMGCEISNLPGTFGTYEPLKMLHLEAEVTGYEAEAGTSKN